MEQVYKQWKNGKNIVVLEYIRLDITIVIYCYFERENSKSWKFHLNIFPYFEISAGLQ